MRYEGGQYYVKSEEEMRALFPYAAQAIENTQKIADRCHVEIEFRSDEAAALTVPDGYDSWTYLNKLCHEGLIQRYPDRYDERCRSLIMSFPLSRRWDMSITS